MTALYYLLITLFLGTSLLLGLIILIQESKSMGLGASFGGDSAGSLFGTSTPLVLKKATAYLALVFFILCLVISIWSQSISPAPSISPLMIESGDSL